MAKTSIWKDYCCFDATESTPPQFNSEKAIAVENGILLHYGQIQLRSQIEQMSSSYLDETNIIREQHLPLNELADKLLLCHKSDDIVKNILSLTGPWAIIYYRHDLKEIFIGCDVFGRKSLLWSRDGDKLFIAPFAINLKLSWSNIPSGTVSVLKVNNIWSDTIIYSTVCIAESLWANQLIEPKFVLLSNLANKLLTVSQEELGHEPMETEVCEAATEMVQRLGDSVQRNIRDVLRNDMTLSLLFSGGIDSLLLAHVLHTWVPSTVIVDLINVSFDDKSSDFGGAPDRCRGIEAFKHLRECYPKRHFRLILVNVSRDELTICRQKHIARFVLPSFSVLDDSIACVLWFAARGEGFLYGKSDENGDTVKVKSDSKIVLVGSGADELFGGYSRHRSSYEKGGRLAAIEEMQQELYRIGERNLARDDRVISALGKDVRAPFLDDVFVEWAIRLPLELKADFTKERGVGEKIIIRQALKKLGAPASLYGAPKRAMQFGTRIAKLEERKEKGSDRCSRLALKDDEYFSV